ncbi:MAG: MarR family winged helix-turn-helix transcriptional regulator [Pseudoflavonifractor sp.]|nr:MarR family winged helix-turn-helix transcriptional regulator [Pseudoflavonifractor sp.]
MYCADEPSAVFHGLHQAHRKKVMEEQAARGLTDLGSPMLLLVLLHGEKAGKIYSQREVAHLLHLAPATVAVSLKSLERSGYVERRTDEKDARRNQVALTDKGHRAVELCGQSFRAVDGRMLAGFSTEERKQLSDYLRRMIENLGGIEPPPFCPREECHVSW